MSKHEQLEKLILESEMKFMLEKYPTFYQAMTDLLNQQKIKVMKLEEEISNKNNNSEDLLQAIELIKRGMIGSSPNNPRHQEILHRDVVSFLGRMNNR